MTRKTLILTAVLLALAMAVALTAMIVTGQLR